MGIHRAEHIGLNSHRVKKVGGTLEALFIICFRWLHWGGAAVTYLAEGKKVLLQNYKEGDGVPSNAGYPTPIPRLSFKSPAAS
ncbi:hypothetical protein FKM82_002513 [Ascaphus truei]